MGQRALGLGERGGVVVVPSPQLTSRVRTTPLGTRIRGRSVTVFPAVTVGWSTWGSRDNRGFVASAFTVASTDRAGL